jgi:hypothetical protein
MELTAYAGEIVNVTTFTEPPKNLKEGQGWGPNVSYLVRVYGYYDVKDPTLLHQFEPVLCNVTLGLDHPKVSELNFNTRVALPAAGIIEDFNQVTYDRRAGTDVPIHRFKGLARNRIVVVNDTNVMTHTVTKTTKAKVMTKATTSRGLVAAIRAAITGAVSALK